MIPIKNNDQSSDGQVDGLSPSELRGAYEDFAQQVTKYEVQDKPVEADLHRIRGAIALASVAERNREHKNAKDFADHAYRWARTQLVKIDFERLQRQLSETTTSRGTDPKRSSDAPSQSADDEELSPAEQSAAEVLDRVRQPERSLQELKGEQLQSKLDDVIEKIILSLTLENHPAYQNQNIGNVLFTGPPGTGKTTAGEGLATELQNRGYDFQFLPIKGHHFKNHLYGSSQEAVEEIFARADETGPTVIFIDEFEEVATRSGDRHEVTQGITNTLLSLLSGGQAAEEIVLIGATNRPEMLDKAIRDRFVDNVVEFTEPPTEIKPDILLDTLRGPGVVPQFGRRDLTMLDYTGLVGRSLETAAKVAIQKSASHPIEPPFEVRIEHVRDALEYVRSKRNGSLASQ